MVSGHLFLHKKHSWPPDEYINRTALQLLDFDGGAPPKHAWRRRLNSHANLLKEFSVTFMEAIAMMRLGIRLWSYIREEASQGRKAPIDPFTRERCRPSASQGVPLGGMGSGSISRGFRGEFKHWQIIPGLCEMSPVMTNQFSIFISRDGGNKKFSSVLAPGQHEGIKKFGDEGISSWNWNLSGQHSTYHALFPRAWTVYDGEPDPELKISCRQISPFVPHDYRESSLPTSVFVYTLVNTGRERAKVSLLLTWANSIGGVSHQTGDHVNEPFRGEDGVSGVLLHHKTAKDNPPVTFAIAACETQNVNVTVLPCFGLSGENCVTAKDMWSKMVQDGQFDHANFDSGASMPSLPGETLCAAVSASTWVEAHGRCTVTFGLSWSSPKVKFQKGCTYHRRTLKEIAIAMHFEIRIVKSDRSRFIAKCSKEGCPWRIHVAKCPGVPTFSIRTLHGDHTCEGVRDDHHHQASVGWVARSVEAQLRANPQYKPKQILQDIREQHGVAVTYMQAWRGKERSMAAVHGTLEEGYRLLPAYCAQVRRTNPGSIASVYATGQENCFHRLFVSYRASIYGFLHACRPLLELDRAHLKGKYLGTLLCASAVDANDQVFPLAFGVVDSESDENWTWFLSELRKLLGVNTDKMPVLTILSERHEGIVEAVGEHFPNSFHGYCLRHVSESFRDEFKNTKLVNLFWSAVYALTTAEFEEKVAEMMKIQDVIYWFQMYPPQLWAVAYFQGVRFGHFDLKITEFLYNWANEGHELPIVQLMELIRQNLAGWFDERRSECMLLTSVLVQSAERLIAEAVADSRCYQVLRANKVEFEIVSSERTNIVDISSRCCSCQRWQIYGIPCAHAAAALLSCGEDIRLYAQECFSVQKYRETYSQMIHPIPDKSLWKDLNQGADGGIDKSDMIIRPPKIRRPPGRPKKKVLRVENIKRPKRVVQCGRCHMLGHSQKKCTLPV